MKTGPYFYIFLLFFVDALANHVDVVGWGRVGWGRVGWGGVRWGGVGWGVY